MENITLGDLRAWLGLIAALIASIVAIVTAVKKVVKKVIKALQKDQTEEINKRFDKIDARLDETDAKVNKIDMEHCKNYLVTFLAEVEQGKVHQEIEMERFHEELEHYTKIGGNSYVKAKAEKLKNDGKL